MKTDIPEASDEFYRIVVRALNDDPAYVGRIIRLGIAYTPTWEGMGTGSFLLINGSDGDIKWPCHSDGHNGRNGKGCRERNSHKELSST